MRCPCVDTRRWAPSGCLIGPANSRAIASQFLTKSGRVEARILERTVHGAAVEISQPLGTVEPLPEPELNKAEILDVLGIGESELAPHPIHNACTSRVKTLIPLASAAILDELQPDFETN